MILFSVGPLTAQVLKISMSASVSLFTSLCPAFVKHPAITSLSAVFAEQPKLLIMIFMM